MDQVDACFETIIDWSLFGVRVAQVSRILKLRGFGIMPKLGGRLVLEEALQTAGSLACIVSEISIVIGPSVV